MRARVDSAVDCGAFIGKDDGPIRTAASNGERRKGRAIGSQMCMDPLRA